MTSLFRCPLCSEPLNRDARVYSCPSGHSFDLAAAGYTHLLPSNQKNSKNPGDDKDMVAARSAFLDKGYYAPLLDGLCQVAVSHISKLPAPVLLDCGCGEGYYTAGLYQALAKSGVAPKVAGIDISKFALRKGAKRLPQGEFAVASVYRLPVADSSVDMLTNVFSPLCLEEFARVLRPGGVFCYAVPSPMHLWEMKQVLYASPYENPSKREDYEGFAYEQVVPLLYTVNLDCSADIMALFGMTPYAWKTPKDGVDRLKQLEHLTCQIGFDLHVYLRAE